VLDGGPDHQWEGVILRGKGAARDMCNKSSAVAEMGDRGHNRDGPKRGGCCAPFEEHWEPV